MAAKTSSFVTEIPLVTSSSDLAVLAARLEAGRQLYNAVLSEGKTRLQSLRNSELYQQARLINKNDKKDKSTAFQKARETYRFSDYDLQAFANKIAIASVWIKSHLDAQVIQKIGWQKGSNQSARTATSSKSPINNGLERMSSNRWSLRGVGACKGKRNSRSELEPPAFRHGVSQSIS